MTDEQWQAITERVINWTRLDAQGWQMLDDLNALVAEVERLRARIAELEVTK
jgi:hypothetical protein